MTDKEMNNNEKRAKVAEACGWKLHPAERDSFGVYHENCANREHATILQSQLPDYQNDANTWPEMLAVMTDGQKTLLASMLLGRKSLVLPVIVQAYSLSQPTRFDLFGKVMGLWELTL